MQKGRARAEGARPSVGETRERRTLEGEGERKKRREIEKEKEGSRTCGTQWSEGLLSAAGSGSGSGSSSSGSSGSSGAPVVW